MESYSKALQAILIVCLVHEGLAVRKKHPTHDSTGTVVDLNDPKVQGHLDALVRMGQSCVIKVRATPKDVRAYFTNSPPITRSGQCFAACMLEQSDVINHGKVNRELLIHLAGLVNGKHSRVVRKLNSVSRLCLDSIEGLQDRCQLASTYNDCLNENMVEFAFPLDIAEEVVRKMPFHLIQPNMAMMSSFMDGLEQIQSLLSFGYLDWCQLSSTCHDCLNENIVDFTFPCDSEGCLANELASGDQAADAPSPFMNFRLDDFNIEDFTTL